MGDDVVSYREGALVFADHIHSLRMWSWVVSDRAKAASGGGNAAASPGRPGPGDVPDRETRRRVIHEIDQALESGWLSVSDLDRLLRSRRGHTNRATAASLLYALGAVVAFCGLAMAYATVFSGLPRVMQITTPFVFPVVALGASIWLARRHLGWQSEVAGLIGCTALAGASAVSIVSSGWVDTARQGAGLAAVSAALTALVGVGLYVRIGSLRLAWLVVPPALGALVGCFAYVIGVPMSMICWVVLGEAALAAGVARHFVARDRRRCDYAGIWALVGTYAAVFLAATTGNFDHLTIWHVILAAVVAGAFVVAGARDDDAMMWIAALGGAWWVVTIAVIVGSATSAALAVVMAGVALAALGLLVTRLRRARRLDQGL
jgi:hypothetical protein